MIFTKYPNDVWHKRKMDNFDSYNVLLAIATNIPVLLKGIVHPKMKILSSFTHPQVVPTLYECLCSAEHKERYSKECGKQSRSGAPLTSIVIYFSYYGSQWCPKTALLHTFFNISSFVFSRTKTFIQVWNYLRVSK